MIMVSSEEYYTEIANIDKEYRHLDEDILIKMFEMRITNQRTFIFAIFAFFVTTIFAMQSYEPARAYFSPEVLFIFLLLPYIPLLFLVYVAARFDKIVTKELKELFKAIDRLHESKDISNNPTSSGLVLRL